MKSQGDRAMVSNITVKRSGSQSEHGRGGGSYDGKPLHSMLFSVCNGGAYGLYGKVMVAVILMARAEGQDTDPEFLLQPLNGGSGHVILTVISQHGDQAVPAPVKGPETAVESLFCLFDLFHSRTSSRTGQKV